MVEPPRDTHIQSDLKSDIQVRWIAEFRGSPPEALPPADDIDLFEGEADEEVAPVGGDAVIATATRSFGRICLQQAGDFTSRLMVSAGGLVALVHELIELRL